MLDKRSQLEGITDHFDKWHLLTCFDIRVFLESMQNPQVIGWWTVDDILNQLIISVTKCSLCLSPSDLFVGGIVSVHPSVVDVPLTPPEKIPRALLTSPGDPMPVGLTIEMFQLMTSWVKANGASRECPSLAMRCVILAWSQPWAPLEIWWLKNVVKNRWRHQMAITCRCSTAQF